MTEPPITINGKTVDRGEFATPRFRYGRNTKNMNNFRARQIVSNSAEEHDQTEKKNIIPIDVIEDKKRATVVEPKPVEQVSDKIIIKGTGTDVEIDLSGTDIPDFDSMTEDEQTQLHSRFDSTLSVIKNNSSGYTIPDHSKMTLRQKYLYSKGYHTFLAINETVRNYRLFWIGGCLICELICVKFMGMTFVKGFTTIQTKNAIDAEIILMELGQTKIGSGQGISEWPAWARLLFNSVVMLLALIIFKLILRTLGLDDRYAETGVNYFMDFANGRRQIPAELIAAATKGVSENPDNPLAGIISNLSMSKVSDAFTSLFKE